MQMKVFIRMVLAWMPRSLGALKRFFLKLRLSKRGGRRNSLSKRQVAARED